MKHKIQDSRFKIQAICFVAVIALAFLFTPTTGAYAQSCTCPSNSACSPPCADATNYKCVGYQKDCPGGDSDCYTGTCSGGKCSLGTCASSTSLVAQDPIKFPSPTGTSTFSDIVCKAIEFFSETILPPIAVLMMLVVGFLFMVGGQMPQKAVAAKKTLLYVIAGVLLLLLAPKIVGLVADIVGASSISSSISCVSTEASTTSIVKTIANLINWFAWFVSITSVVMGLYAGLLYLTARGDSSQVLKATKVFSYTIIGIAVSVVAFSIIILTKTFFGI